MSDSDHQPLDTSGSGSEGTSMRITPPLSTSTSTAPNMSVHFSSGKDDWETPDDLFDRLNGQFNFVLDAAANSTNRKCGRWFGPGGVSEDALVVDWPLEEGNIWLNPPYSRGLQAKFVEKAVEEHDRAWQVVRGECFRKGAEGGVSPSSSNGHSALS
jgi:hypothetical protein